MQRSNMWTTEGKKAGMGSETGTDIRIAKYEVATNERLLQSAGNSTQCSMET